MKCKSAGHAHLKNKIENNPAWEGAFYQSEWAKANSSWELISFFNFKGIQTYDSLRNLKEFVKYSLASFNQNRKNVLEYLTLQFFFTFT